MFLIVIFFFLQKDNTPEHELQDHAHTSLYYLSSLSDCHSLITFLNSKVFQLLPYATLFLVSGPLMLKLSSEVPLLPRTHLASPGFQVSTLCLYTSQSHDISLSIIVPLLFSKSHIGLQSLWGQGSSIHYL